MRYRHDPKIGDTSGFKYHFPKPDPFEPPPNKGEVTRLLRPDIGYADLTRLEDKERCCDV